MRLAASEQAIDTMARLFACRRTARFLLRERYDAAVTPYRDLVSRVMAHETLMPLQAALRLAEQVPAADAMPVMLFMAAAIDLIEMETR